MAVEEKGDAALATAEYWNARYSRTPHSANDVEIDNDNDNENDHRPPPPTHEWLRTFKTLQPFLQRHLYAPYPPHSRPRILHLGSGDSVRFFLSILY